MYKSSASQDRAVYKSYAFVQAGFCKRLAFGQEQIIAPLLRKRGYSLLSQEQSSLWRKSLAASLPRATGPVNRDATSDDVQCLLNEKPQRNLVQEVLLI